jgi:hypothetical protein
MQDILNKIDELIGAIILIKKNRLFFTVEDLEQLDECILKLEALKRDIDGTESFQVLKARFLEVIIILDKFFGLGDYLQQLFDLP